VAQNSQGISISIDDAGAAGDLNVFEVVSVSIDGIVCDTVEVTSRSDTGRSKLFRPADTDYGTASFVMRFHNYITESVVGESCLLTIADSGYTYWSGRSIIQSLAWRASVGELQEYSVTLKLGAQS
jgi:hypothetical protein